MQIDIPGIGLVEFPDDMSDADLAVAAGKLHAEAQRNKPAAPKDDSSMADWLPAAGGVIGGIAGTAAGPVGTAVGAALGGGGGEGIRQIIRRVQGKSAPQTMTDAAADIGITGALEGAAGLVGGGIAKAGSRLIRGVSRVAIPDSVKTGANAAIDLLPGTAGRVARGARTLSRGFGEAAEKPSVMAEGFDRWMPNTSARPLPAANKLPSGLTPRALSEGEERGIAELDDLLTSIHGPERVTRGNGLMPSTAAPRDQLVRELMRSEAGESATGKAVRSIDDINADFRADTLRSRARREGMESAEDQAARHARELAELRGGGRLTKAGQSMLTEDEESLFANALRELRSGSPNRIQTQRR